MCRQRERIIDKPRERADEPACRRASSSGLIICHRDVIIEVLPLSLSLSLSLLCGELTDDRRYADRATDAIELH